MKRIVLAVALLAASGLAAQSIPEVSEALQLKITRIQNDQLAAQVEASSLQARLTQLSQQFASDSTQLADLQAQAFKEAKLSADDYTLDPKTLKFTAKPKPAKEPNATKQ